MDFETKYVGWRKQHIWKLDACASKWAEKGRWGKNSIMKKIANNPYYDNYIILKGIEIEKVRCTYEIGRYGIISTIGGHLV